MPAKKVLYFCNYFQPMHYGENEISQALQKQGYLVKIVTGDRYFPFPNYADTAGKLLGPRQQPVGETVWQGIPISRQKIWLEFAARALFFGIQSTVREFQPDTLLVSGISTPVAIQAALFKPKNARLILVDSHLPSELMQGNQLLKRLFYWFFRVFFASLISQRADKIIAVQEGTVTVVKDIYGISYPTTVISHGTDAELFQFSSTSRKKLRHQLNIPQTAFVIITTGKIIPAKGVDLLFQAMRSLLQHHSNIHLVIVGDGPPEYLKKCWQGISVVHKKNIHVVGFQPQEALPAYYSAADVAVWPLQESLAMNDAMSCGLPLIVNDQLGVKERLSNHNALQYIQGDVLDLVSKIEYLQSHPAERKKFGQRARELVEKQLQWKQKAKKYLEI